MGYTHYWERPPALPRPQFLAAAADCRRLCAALPIPLGDAGGGAGRPAFGPAEVCFNGRVDGGDLTAGVQRAAGLVWPQPDARGVAVAGEAGAVAGTWSAGPAVRARVLGASGDGSYETFRVRRVERPRRAAFAAGDDAGDTGWVFGCCKTNYRPYDLCVQACLIVLSHHLGPELFRVHSDGDTRQWDDARDACQHVLGYGLTWGEGKLAPAGPARPPADP